MKYINKIKSALLTIYNNIKYISCNDLEYLDEKIHDVSSELDDKCDNYDVEDIINSNIGCVDDLLTQYDLDDIETIEIGITEYNIPITEEEMIRCNKLYKRYNI